MEKIEVSSPFESLEHSEGNPGARLISAILIRALADFYYGNEVLKKNAEHFFYSEDFNFYCNLLYGVDCDSEVAKLRQKMIGEGLKNIGKHGRSGRRPSKGKKPAIKSLIFGAFLFLGIGAAEATPSHEHQRCNNLVKVFTQNNCSMARLTTFARPEKQIFQPKDETGRIITNFLQKQMIQFDKNKPRSNWESLTTKEKAILFAKINAFLGEITEISSITPNVNYSLLSVTYPGLGFETTLTPSQFFSTGKYLLRISRRAFIDQVGMAAGEINRPAIFDGIEFATPRELFWYIANRILLMEPEERYYEILQILGITPPSHKLTQLQQNPNKTLTIL